MSKQRNPLAITVVVPVSDGVTSIERCLAAIRENGPGEVILINDGASEHIVEVARDHVDRVIDADTGADLCQIGARDARNPWVAFVTADVVLEPDALYQLTCLSLAERLRAADTALLVGRAFVLDRGLSVQLSAEQGFNLGVQLARSDESIGARLGRLVREQGAVFAGLLALGVGAGFVLAVRAVGAAYQGTAGATALVAAGIALIVTLEVARSADHPRIRAAVATFATPVTSLAVLALALAATRLASVIGI
jgi:hypothetical protein